MTKFTKAILLAAALIFAPLSAAQADNDIGCGVGTEIFKGQAGPVPGNIMPKASVSAFMVEAVPIVLQCPSDGADEQIRPRNSG